MSQTQWNHGKIMLWLSIHVYLFDSLIFLIPIWKWFDEQQYPCFYYCIHHVRCIMYSSCFYGLYSYINCMMITVSMFLPLYSSCMMNHVFMACIHSFIHSGNNTCVFVHDFINESKLSLSLSLFLPSSIPIPVFSSHGAYMIWWYNIHDDYKIRHYPSSFSLFLSLSLHVRRR